MPVLKISSGSNRVLTGNFLNYNRYWLLYRLMEQATASKYITIYYCYTLGYRYSSGIFSGSMSTHRIT